MKEIFKLNRYDKNDHCGKKKEEEEKQSQQSKSPWNTAARYPLNDQWVGTPCSAFKIFTFN